MRKACIQCGAETLLLRCLAKKSEQSLNDLRVSGFVGRIDAVFPHAIVFRQFNRLTPFLVATVHVGRNTTELKQFVSSQFGGKSNHIEVLEAIDRLSQSFVVFVFQVELNKQKWKIKLAPSN